MALLRISEVRPLEGFRLKLTLTDGSVIERDVSRLLVGPVFDPVRKDPSFFRKVRAQDGTVVLAERRRSLPGCFNLGRPSS